MLAIIMPCRALYLDIHTMSNVHTLSTMSTAQGGNVSFIKIDWWKTKKNNNVLECLIINKILCIWCVCVVNVLCVLCAIIIANVFVYHFLFFHLCIDLIGITYRFVVQFAHIIFELDSNGINTYEICIMYEYINLFYICIISEFVHHHTHNS